MTTTIAACIDRMTTIVGNTYTVAKTRNKGGAGHYLEELLGIPHTSNCLDCADGEIKAFPLKTLKSGAVVPKETVAVTMCNPADLARQTFDESNVRKKLCNTLFVPYMWAEDGALTFYPPTLFTPAHPLWDHVVADYALLQAHVGDMAGRHGKYLQTRTKGAGHGSTSRAFYLRPLFTKELFGTFKL